MLPQVSQEVPWDLDLESAAVSSVQVGDSPLSDTVLPNVLPVGMVSIFIEHLFYRMKRTFAYCLSGEEEMDCRSALFRFLEKQSSQGKLEFMESVLDLNELHQFLKYINLSASDQIVKSFVKMHSLIPPLFHVDMIVEIIGRITLEEGLEKEIRKLFQLLDVTK